MLSLDDPRLRLNEIVTKHDASAARNMPAQSPDAQQEAIVGAFDHLVRDVIRPEMESIGAELRRREYEYEILIEPGQQITMRFYPPLHPRMAYTTGCCPSVAFSRDASTAKIHVVQSTLMPDDRGDAVIADTLSPFQLTRREVAARLFDVLEKLQREPASAVRAAK